MSLNIRRALASMLLAAGLVVVALPAASLAQTAAQVTVDAVAVVDGQITITGADFGSAPTVTLGEDPLSVASASDSEIVAQIPALDAGFYLLTVARDAGSDPAHVLVTIQ